MHIRWEGLPGGPASGSAGGVCLCVSLFPPGAAGSTPGSSSHRGAGSLQLSVVAGKGDRAGRCPLQGAPALAGPPPAFLPSEKNTPPGLSHKGVRFCLKSPGVILRDTEKERQASLHSVRPAVSEGWLC